MARIRKVFTGGNTSQGFYSLHDNIIGENRNMLYIIKGTPGGGKSTLMEEIGKRLLKKGFDVEYHHCPSDPYSIDALVVDKLKIGIVDGTPPHSMDPIYPALKDKIIDLGRFIDKDKLKYAEKDILNARHKNKYAYKSAFSYLKAAGVVFELIEETNRRYSNAKKINKKAAELVDEVFSLETTNKDFEGFAERHLFYNAYTPEGFIDYTDTVLEHIKNVYYIQGEIGSDKDLILKKIFEIAKLKNYKVEIARNSLIADKFESVFIKDTDTIVTLNENGKDFAKLILDLNKYIDADKFNKNDYHVFDLLVSKGIESLKSAKDNHFILERSYKAANDYSQMDKIKDSIYREILTYI